MKVDFLGTGTMGCSNRINTSILINDEILFDIGSGTVNQLRSLNKDLTKIKYIIISHYHADHFLDMAFFLIRRHSITKSEKKLVVIGPKEIRNKVIDLMYFTHGDNKTDKYKNIEDEYNLRFIEMNETEETIDNYTLKSITLKHGTCEPCNGYILKNKEISISYTGDTNFNDELELLIESANHIFIDTTSNMGDEDHVGYIGVKALAYNNKDKYFYAIHRGDFKTDNEFQNILYPNDGDEINL